MPKMLLLVSAVLLLISAGLGFVNKGKIAAKQADLDQTHVVAKAAQADAATAKTKQKKAEKDAADAVAKTTDLQGQLTAATTQVTTLNGEVESTKKQIADNDEKIKGLQETIARINSNSGPKPDAAAPDANKLAELQIQLSEMKTVKDSLESQLKTAQSSVDKYRRENEVRANNANMVGLQGRILAVNRDWNFVVLSLGNRQGVNNNTTMLVQRGGSTVGKVHVTAVEPSQSIADIVPNSVPPGVIVQPGDTVVFPGI